MDRKWFLKLLSVGTIGSVMPTNISDGNPSKKVIKPKKLQKGDTIGLISPGFFLPDQGQYDEIVSQVIKMGYKVKEGPNARNRYGYLAGTDKQRADDLNAMFADDTVDAIMPFRGGWGCNRILPLIDFNLIKNNPKILVGFSDITTLLLSIFAKTGLITFHGPVGKSDWTDFTTRYFNKVLRGQQILFDTPKNEFCEDCNQFSTITPGRAQGPLLGGNLSVLTAMMGSDYLPDWKNSILFLEDVGEDVYRIDRMLTQLKLNGIFDKVSGIVFGKCNSCAPSDSYGFLLQEILEQHLAPYSIPVFTGAMVGHIENNITLPVGLPVQIDARRGSIELINSAVV